MHESWRVALSTLRLNPLRTLLSTLGVVIGDAEGGLLAHATSTCLVVRGEKAAGR